MKDFLSNTIEEFERRWNEYSSRND